MDRVTIFRPDAWTGRRDLSPSATKRHTVRMLGAQSRTAAWIVAALAGSAAGGCGVDDAPKSPSKSAARSFAKARCAGAECRVRIVCKGKVHVRLGPAPVRVRTSKTALVTSFYADFAGSASDVEIRC
jgi:hypothetical protein